MKKENIIKACEDLASTLTREDLINFIINTNSRYTEQRAEDFINWISSDNFSKDALIQFKIRAALICSWLFYSFDFRSDIENKLTHFIQIEKKKAEDLALERYNEQEKAKFREVLIKFYKWELTREQVEEIFNPNKRTWNTDYKATINKIENKLKTKSHTLEKVEKVINEDIERDYHKSIQLGEEMWKKYQKMTEAHGFGY